MTEKPKVEYSSPWRTTIKIPHWTGPQEPLPDAVLHGKFYKSVIQIKGPEMPKQPDKPLGRNVNFTITGDGKIIDHLKDATSEKSNPEAVSEKQKGKG